MHPFLILIVPHCDFEQFPQLGTVIHRITGHDLKLSISIPFRLNRAGDSEHIVARGDHIGDIGCDVAEPYSGAIVGERFQSILLFLPADTSDFLNLKFIDMVSQNVYSLIGVCIGDITANGRGFGCTGSESGHIPVILPLIFTLNQYSACYIGCAGLIIAVARSRGFKHIDRLISGLYFVIISVEGFPGSLLDDSGGYEFAGGIEVA